MGDIVRPHRGSMQIWPRVRAKRLYARVRRWHNQGQPKLLAFAGYKAGMTHILLDDKRANSRTKGDAIAWPVTVLECPPLKAYAVRFYKKDLYGWHLAGSIYHPKPAKELARKTAPSTKNAEPADFDRVRLVVYTQPWLLGLKKKPELFEIQVGGTKEDALKLAKGFLEKDIKLSDVFKEGQLVDVHAVTKGKGHQGTVKRFGVRIRQHKAEKTKRGIGTLGSWHPNRVDYRVAQAGRMGTSLRTEYNKLLLKMGTKPEDITQKGGFLHYGPVQHDYVLLKGSVAGPAKRLITLTEPSRPYKLDPNMTITYISRESKQ